MTAGPVRADEMPIQFERVTHSPKQLGGLAALNTRLFAGAFGGTLELDAALRVQRFQNNGGFAPIDFRKGAFHVLGGDISAGFVGHTPYTAVLTGQGNPIDAVVLPALPALDLYDAPSIDNHELLTDMQGNFWFLRYPMEDCDAYPGMCGPTPPEGVSQFASCTISQVSPAGQLLFEWSALDHLPQSELRYAQWIDRRASTIYADVADPLHCNSIDVDESGKRILVSMRHTDSIYMIDKGSGRVLWKIGGNRWPGTSLSVTDLPKSQRTDPLAGQHDARIQGTDSISVFDNSTGLSRPARGIVFDIDRKRSTASARQVMSSPFRESSNCTGSFRQFASGRFWVAGWGCADTAATVFDAAGKPLVSIRPALTVQTQAYFDTWPRALRDILKRQVSYRFTPSSSE